MNLRRHALELMFTTLLMCDNLLVRVVDLFVGTIEYVRDHFMINLINFILKFVTIFKNNAGTIELPTISSKGLTISSQKFTFAVIIVPA